MRPLRSWLSTVLSPSRRCLESGLCSSQFCFLCLSGLTTLQSRLKLPHCVQRQRRVHWDSLATSHLLPGKSQPCQRGHTAFQIGPRAAHHRLRGDGCPAPTRPPAYALRASRTLQELFAPCRPLSIPSTLPGCLQLTLQNSAEENPTLMSADPSQAPWEPAQPPAPIPSAWAP